MSMNSYDESEVIDPTKLRYALYARKSTDDPKRQSTSIDDQIAECERMASSWGIKLQKPYIREEKSAKAPNNRTKFTKLIEDLKRGEYDGIVAWHPDRLARNMKEGGEIIHLIDTNTIKDLKFCTHHFNNDASGIMLLGMAFVLSKEYSDRLSANVSRGVKRNFKQGKSAGQYKAGYTINEDNRYEPDKKTFPIVKNAWKMKLNGASLSDISNEMNASGFRRFYKGNVTKSSEMTPQKLSKLFQDPIYYGYLLQAGNMNDLSELYDFVPMITKEQFSEVQALSRSKLPYTIKKRHTFLPLKQMVMCSFCERTMYAGASKGSKGKRYLYYSCQNKFCERKIKSIRAKEVFQWIYDFLEEGLNFSEEEFKRVQNRLSSISDTKKNKLMMEANSLRSAIRSNDSKMKELALNIPKLDKDTKVWEINNNQLDKIDEENERHKRDLEKVMDKLSSAEGFNITVEKLLNLSKDARATVMAGTQVQKDNILRKIFLNLTVNEKEVVSYLCKEPFATLLKDKSILNGRGDRT